MKMACATLALTLIALPVADNPGPMIMWKRNLVFSPTGSSSNLHCAVGRSGSLTFQAARGGLHASM